jgi:hypothetical protein
MSTPLQQRQDALMPCLDIVTNHACSMGIGAMRSKKIRAGLKTYLLRGRDTLFLTRVFFSPGARTPELRTAKQRSTYLNVA